MHCFICAHKVMQFLKIVVVWSMHIFKKSLSCHLVALSLAMGLFAFGATPARADLRVCNETDVLVGVAIGYRAEAGWITEGWWHIDGGACKTMIEGPLQSRYYYLYAEDAQRGGRWTGDINMCIAEKEFKIIGFNDCFARGFQRAGFQEHDTGSQPNWMIQLTGSQTSNSTPENTPEGLVAPRVDAEPSTDTPTDAAPVQAN